MLISLEYQQEIINKEEQTITPDYLETCLNVFVKWCNKFLTEKRDYIVIRTPLLKNLLDLTDNDFIETDSKNGIYLNGKSKIIIDPLIRQFYVNDYLCENKVIVAISMPADGFLTQRMVQINAIIPFRGMYFKYQSNYYYLLSVNYRKFKNKDISTIAELLGKKFTKLIMEGGDGISEMFFINNYIWEPGSNREEFLLNKININPHSQPISLFDLIYNY